jgi:hypothetical protein
MASSVASKSLKSGTFAPAITTERGPPSASTSRERLTPFLALSVGLGPTRSPKARLAHRPIGGLPLEVNSAEFLALLDELLPDEIEYAKLDPPLQSAVHRGVVGELFLGQLVPLAAATHPEDDRIEGLALVYARTTGALWRIVLFEDRFDDDPQLIGYSPNSGKRLLWGRVLGHIGTSSLRE